MYLEAIPLKRGSDSFISAPQGLVDLDENGCFQIKVTNMTSRRICVRSRELLGHLFKAKDTLKSAKELSEEDQIAFLSRATQLTTLMSNLDRVKEAPPEKEPALGTYSDLEGTEHLGWGPKTTDPGPDQVYPSDKLREIIDVDPALDPAQRNALYKVIEKNQAAFGFDRRLGH
jgi:hypothetical protein